MRVLFSVFMMVFCSNVFANGLEVLKKYAENGDVGAMNTLGFIYVTGKNTPKNNTEAIKWFEKAAYQGEYQSMNSLAIMHQVGDGVPSNLAKAWAWYSLAAIFIQKEDNQNNIPKSKVDSYLRIPEKIALHLNQNELDEARALQFKLNEEINNNLAQKPLNFAESSGIRRACPLVSKIEFRVFHILYNTKQEALETYSKIINDDKDKLILFKNAAKNSMDGGSNQIGGDLGYVKANFSLNLMDAILTSPLHALSTPVKSEFGWHLIWVEDARDALTQISCSQWPNP